MSLLLLANTVYANTAQLLASDTSNVATSDQAGLYTITGTQRQLAWTSGATADRRLAYINKLGNLSCTHVVLSRADKHLNHTIQIHSFETYTGSSTLQYNSGSAFAETLIGPLGQDWVKALTMSNKEALAMSFIAGTGGNYTKVVHSLYFCNAITFSYPGSVIKQPLPFGARHLVKHQGYLYDEQQIYRASDLTRAELTAFEQVYRLRENPVFLYDSVGGLIPDKLAHGMISNYVVNKRFHDVYDLEIAFLALRHWS